MKLSTYMIKRSQIEKIFDMADYVSVVEKAFRLYGQGEAQMPPKVYLAFLKGDFRSMPAYIPAMKIAGVKNVNVHPANKDLPTVMATITLVDPDTGFPVAVMDGTHITNMRTGAAGAIAAKYLSREDSEVAAFIGAGIQAQALLEALVITRPKISKVIIYDILDAKMNNFADSVRKRHSLEVELAGSVKEAVRDADIVTTATPVRKPLVKTDYIREGTHINAMGADAAGKQELDAQILRRARIVVDNWEQASSSGEVNVALSKGIIAEENIYADIGEIITGKKLARESSDQITVFDSTGLAIQDICAAGQIYRKLISDKELSPKLSKIDFFCDD